MTIPSPRDRPARLQRAAHASSVGPIDPAQLFYLESRGITPDEARKFITLGFLEPVVARVPLESEQRAPVGPAGGEVGARRAMPRSPPTGRRAAAAGDAGGGIAVATAGATAGVA